MANEPATTQLFTAPVSETTKEAIRQMCRKDGISEAELLRRAVGAFDALRVEWGDGNEIRVYNPNTRRGWTLYHTVYYPMPSDAQAELEGQLDGKRKAWWHRLF